MFIRTEKPDKTKLKNLLAQFYNNEMLRGLFNAYIKQWIKEGINGISISGLQKNLITNTYEPVFEQIPRDKFIEILIKFYSDKEFFREKIKMMPDYVKNLFYMLSQYDGVPYDDFVENIKANITIAKNKFNDEACFFKPHQQYENYGFSRDSVTYIHVNRGLREALAYVMPIPVTGILKQREPESMYFANFEKDIMENIGILMELKSSGKISIGKTGKLLKASIKNINDSCLFGEMYEKEFTAGQTEIRKRLIAELVCKQGSDAIFKNSEKGNHEIIKNIVSNLLTCSNFTGDFSLISSFVDAVYGSSSADAENQGSFYRAIYNTVKRIGTVDGWLSMGNITENIEFTEEKWMPVSNYIVAKLYYNEKVSLPSGSKTHTYVQRGRIASNDEIGIMICYPVIRGVFGLFAFLGLFEIGYDEIPKIDFIEKEFIGFFDGLKYIKMTPLGRYVFGFSTEYDYKVEKTLDVVHLDDSHLIVTMEGDGTLKRLFLDTIGTKISRNKYIISYETFFKEIKNSKDIPKKIKDFEKKISKELPQNWKDFFEKVKSKADKISLEDKYIVLKLDEDAEFIKIVSNDRRIKAMSLKAEGYRLLVEKKNVQVIYEILKGYGYYN